MFFEVGKETKEPKIVAWVGEYYPPMEHEPFSFKLLTKVGRNHQQKLVIKTAQQLLAEQLAIDKQIMEIEARLDAELDNFKPIGSVKRWKLAITSDQLERRHERNTTCKTIFRGHVVNMSYDHINKNGEPVHMKNIYREGSVRKYVRHDSHGSHGRKGRYKDIDRTSIRNSFS